MEADLIVGAGPIGLACAISARRRGLDPLVIDTGAIAQSIVRYPIGMTFFTTPERLEIGGHPLVSAGAKTTREEALKYYRGVARAEGIRVRTFTRLIGAARHVEGITCRLLSHDEEEELTCARLVLATGYFEHPNLLGVPGEDLPHVSHWFDEPHVTAGQDIVIVGGKNSAVEAALLCFRAGARVTLVQRRTEFKPSVKYWLRPDIENRIKAGEIKACFGAVVEGITRREVIIRTGDRLMHVPADRVYALTGYHPDFELFQSMGIELEPSSGRPTINPANLETNVPGIHMAGSTAAGRDIGDVFIENGRFDGEKIFGNTNDAAQAEKQYRETLRPVGE
ncbi:MAG TPA: YpdA family putative bacillithiol disulfide reductase [Gemmatimonadales bacterium]|nr:YpdA family putative bacillithiol disulfide reductase [Gemmatimonadales bacterium]